MATADITGMAEGDARDDLGIGSAGSLSSMSSRGRASTSTIVIKLGTIFFLIQQSGNGMNVRLLCFFGPVYGIVMVLITGRDIFNRP